MEFAQYFKATFFNQRHFQEEMRFLRKVLTLFLILFGFIFEFLIQLPFLLAFWIQHRWSKK